MTRPALEKWTKEELFHDGKSFFARLLAELSAATHSIELETYIFRDDTTGKTVAKALAEAARRGIQVRVLVDGFGSAGWVPAFFETLSAAGVKARIYHPLPWTALPTIHHFFTLILNLNRRDHRKVCVIDKKVAWVGSMNVTDAEGWRDTGARLEGPMIEELIDEFDRTWHNSWSFERGQVSWFRRARLRAREYVNYASVRTNSTRAERHRLHLDFVARIRAARRRVWLTNAYFVPGRKLQLALKAAASSGTDVRVLIPQNPDVIFIRWVGLMFYQRLLAANVRIFEYRPGVLHAKTALIDGWALVGSTNMNQRSQLHDLEADVVLMTPESLASLERQFQRDIEQSQEVSCQTLDKLPLWQRLLGRVFLLIRYWI